MIQYYEIIDDIELFEKITSREKNKSQRTIECIFVYYNIYIKLNKFLGLIIKGTPRC